MAVAAGSSPSTVPTRRMRLRMRAEDRPATVRVLVRVLYRRSCRVGSRVRVLTSVSVHSTVLYTIYDIYTIQVRYSRILVLVR